MKAKILFLGLALTILLASVFAFSTVAADPVEFRLTVKKDGEPVNASISVYTVKNYVQKNKLIASGSVINGSFEFNYSEKFNKTLYLLYIITIEGEEYRSYNKYSPDDIKSETVVINQTTGENVTIYYVEDTIKLGKIERGLGWVAARSTLILGGIFVVVVILAAVSLGGKRRR